MALQSTKCFSLSSQVSVFFSHFGCDERSGPELCDSSVFKRQPWQLHKGWELKLGSCCYFPGTGRLSRIDQQWVCHKSVNLSPVRSLWGADAPRLFVCARVFACVCARVCEWRVKSNYTKRDFKTPSHKFQWFTVNADKHVKQGDEKAAPAPRYPTVRKRHTGNDGPGKFRRNIMSS